MSKIREFKIANVNIELHDFGYAQYYYPSFNGDAEFKATSKGFRELSSYVRTVLYFNNLIEL